MVKVVRAFCWHQKFVPKEFSALAPGLYTCLKSLKMRIKSDFKEIILKLATYGQRVKAFLFSLKFVPSGLSAPARGYIHMVKHEKNVYKIGLQSNFFFKPATNGQSDKGFLLTSTFVPMGLSAPALGLYTCINALKYIPGPGVRWAFTGPLVLHMVSARFSHDMAHIQWRFGVVYPINLDAKPFCCF